MNEQRLEALIGQLKRSNRRWKVLALGTLAALVLGVAGFLAYSAVQVGRARAAAEAERIAAEKARR
jgi:hypothetical protein